jgi:hypothetical protein
MNTTNCSTANFYVKDTLFKKKINDMYFVTPNLTPYIMSATVILVSMYRNGLKMTM